jgi:ABC-type polysaccharide/polyol phosphate export permease
MALSYYATAGSARALGEIAALTERRVRHLRRAPGRLIGVALNPLVMLVTVGYLFRGAITAPGSRGGYLGYLMAGICVQIALAGIGPGAMSVALDLRTGLIDRLRTMPITRSAVLVSHALGDLMVGTGVLLLVSAIGLLMGWRLHGSPFAIAAGFLLVVGFVFGMTWVGITLGATVGNPESIESIGALGLVLLTFVSDAIFPAADMPVWLRPVIDWSPVSAVADACRSLWGSMPSGARGFPAQHALFVALVWIAVFLLVGVALAGRRFRAAGA